MEYFVIFTLLLVIGAITGIVYIRHWKQKFLEGEELRLFQEATEKRLSKEGAEGRKAAFCMNCAHGVIGFSRGGKINRVACDLDAPCEHYARSMEMMATTRDRILRSEDRKSGI